MSSRILCLLAFASLSFLRLSAGEGDLLPHVRTEMRMDWQNDFGHPGEGGVSDNGFRVNNIYLIVDGRIDEHFTYKYRQRLNRYNLTSAVMESVDWAQLIWSPDEHWSFAAGKQVMEVGSMEYDANPIDVFRYSEWIQHARPYQLGISAQYNLEQGDNLTFQISQSLCDPTFFTYYSYNFSWRRNVSGIWRPYYSVNLHQYAQHGYMAMAALGNRFHFGDHWFCIDWVQRCTDDNLRQPGNLWQDFSLIGCADWQMNDYVKLTIEASYDHNADDKADILCREGTRLGVVGGGLLWTPFGTPLCRLHFTGSHTFGQNPLGTLCPGAWQLNVGLTWRFDIIKGEMK